MKIQNNPHLQYNGPAVINTDIKGYDEYITRRKVFLQQKSNEEQMKSQINILEDELQQMKSALKTLLEKG